MEMMILRNFSNTDIEELQKHGYSKLSKIELETLIKTWNGKEYNGNYFEMFALEENGVIVGNASLYGRSGHIVSCGLEVYSAFRGKGYSTQAYESLLMIAKEKGFTIAVAQVLKENAASIALNRKMGFEAEDYTYLNQKGKEVYYFIKAL